MNEETPQFVSTDDLRAILEEYRKKQMVENLSGPTVSFALHVIALTLLFIILIKPPKPQPDPDLPVIKITLDEPDIDIPTPPTPPEIEEEVVEQEVKPAAPASAPDPDNRERAEEQTVEFTEPGIVEGAEVELVNFDVPNPSRIHIPTILNRRGDGGGKGLREGWGPEWVKRPIDPEEPLTWLQRVQLENGSWENNPAHTGLALLTFLAYGNTPISERFGKTVENGLRWLIQEQASKGNFGRAYSHGIATYALADGYAMTGIPMLKEAMEQAVVRIMEGQQAGGGFDYRYNKGERWDLSVSGWQYQAMKSALMAGSTNEDLPAAIAKAENFLKSTYSNGKFGYSNNKVGSGGNMTGVGIVSLQFIGHGDAPQVRRAIETIRRERLAKYRAVMEDPRKWKHIGGQCVYGWYYDTQALFYHSIRDKRPWKEWAEVCLPVLKAARNPKGYWEVDAKHGQGPTTGGRILTTTWCMLQVAAPIRFLPTFNAEKHEKTISSNPIETVGGGGQTQDGLIIEIR